MAKRAAESGLDRAKRLALTRLDRGGCSIEELVAWLTRKACEATVQENQARIA